MKRNGQLVAVIPPVGLQNSELKGVALTRRAFRRTTHGGFTLTELVVVMATTGLLVVMVLPTLAFSKAKSQAVYCLSHYNQLAQACAMYTSDYRELYPPNPDEVSATPGYNWVGGQENGCAPPAPGNQSKAADPQYVKDPKWSLLVPYLGQNSAVFKCPDDPRLCYFPAGTSNVVPVVRTVSCNAGVGTIPLGWTGGDPASTGKPLTAPVYGPWLTGSHNEAYSSYATFGKTTDFKNCSPSDIWNYVDDDPWSINDASMVVVAEVPEFVDWPGTLHQNATSFAFSDGHTELHQWKTTGYPLVHTADPGAVAIPRTSPLYSDWYWWAWHATRNLNTGSVP